MDTAISFTTEQEKEVGNISTNLRREVPQK